MIFDTLCEIANVWFPELVPILQYATIIKFDVTAHKVLDKQVPPDDVITFRDEFTLPTRIVAIEDKADCTILMDGEPNMRGLFKRRAFINCLPVDRAITEPYAEIGDIGLMRSFAKIAPPGTCIVVIGDIEPKVANIGKWGVEASISKVFVGSASMPLVGPEDAADLDPEIVRETTMSSAQNAMTAIEELVEIHKKHWRMTTELHRSREILVPVHV